MKVGRPCRSEAVREGEILQGVPYQYCQYRYNCQALFRTVGNDATFYQLPTANPLGHYLKLMPEDFEMCLKV